MTALSAQGVGKPQALLAVCLVSLNQSNFQEEFPFSYGTTTIGRGPLLKIVDKRVSRSHAVIELTDTSVQIKPVHTNPTFLKSKGTQKYCILKKDCWKTLEDGDLISLLPENLIFEVKIMQDVRLHENAHPESENSMVSKDELKKSVEINEHEVGDITSIDDEQYGTDHSEYNTEANRGHQPKQLPVNDCAKSATLEESPAKLLNKKRALPSWMMQPTGTQNRPTKKARKAIKQPAPAMTEDQGLKIEEASMTPVQNTNEILQVGLTSEIEVAEDKMIESTSLVTDTAANVEAEMEKSRESLNMDLQASHTGDDNASADLPLCPYGSKCYRKNPTHFKEYSHASINRSTSENENQDLPECPYGSNCYRKNPDHFMEFKHFSQQESDDDIAEISRRRRKGRGKRSALDDDSDDDGEPNTYNYDDSFIDDKEGSDSSVSYNDESDNSDYKPESDEEEVDDLIAEAKSFIRNAKLQRK